MKGLKSKQLSIRANLSSKKYMFHQKQSVYLSGALANDTIGKLTSFICNVSVIGHSLIDMKAGFSRREQNIFTKTLHLQ